MTIKDLVAEGKELVEMTVPKITKWVDEYETDDYPYGRERTKATFTIEKRGKKSRVARVTINPKTGRANKAKKSTYGLATKIGIGADGKTYIIQLGEYGGISIMMGTMKHSESIFFDDPHFEEFFSKLTSRKNYALYKRMKEKHDANPPKITVTTREIAYPFKRK